MANQVTINSEAASSVMTYVANSCTILQSEVKGKITSSFEPLVSLGFLPNAVTKVEAQVDSLINAHNSIVSEISSHLQDVQSQEDGLYSGYQGGVYSGGYSGGSSGGGSSSGSDESLSCAEIGIEEASPIEETAITVVSEGLKVNSNELIEMFDSIGDAYKTTLIKLIDSHKSTDTSLIDLLLDNSASKELYKSLKSIFGDSLDMDDFTLEDYEKVQKYILNMFMKSDVDIPKLTEDSILAGKEYLVKVCSDNKIEPSDLFFDDKYKDLLKQSLMSIYDGDVGDTLTEKQIRNFRYAVDSTAKLKDISSEELIENHLELLI